MRIMEGSSFPYFLGIGAMKAGSSWLHNLLKSNPELCLPHVKKEVQFFDLHFQKGQRWYTSFFHDREKKCGEVTPTYLDKPSVPGRVRDMNPDCRFLLILRDPIQRAFSAYRYKIQDRGTDETFMAYLTNKPAAIDKGLYAKHLRNWMRIFPKEQFLVILLDDVKSDTKSVIHQIAEFLDVDEDGFRLPERDDEKNVSFVPRHHRLYVMGSKTANWLTKRNLDAPINLARSMGLHTVLSRPSGKRLPVMDSETRKRVYPLFREDIDDLERLLERDLSIWRPV